MWDSSGEIRQRLGRRDSRARDSDWFTVAMDTHHDHQNAYQFSLNPAGVKRDEIGNGGFRGDDSWDAVWGRDRLCRRRGVERGNPRPIQPTPLQQRIHSDVGNPVHSEHQPSSRRRACSSSRRGGSAAGSRASGI